MLILIVLACLVSDVDFVFQMICM